MHAIVITFDLVDMTAEEYAEVCSEFAPSFAALPGLLTKVWLGDAEHVRRGGFYLFRDTDAADGFLASALAHAVAQNPHFDGLTVARYEVDEATTAVTQPGITVVGIPAAV